MSDKPNTNDTTDPKDTTDQHEDGKSSERNTGGMSPMGQHEGGLAGPTAQHDSEKKPAGVASGQGGEGGSPESE